MSFTKTFLKGDTGSTPAEFDGLQARIGSDYIVSAGSTGIGDALSLAKLDELVDTCEDGTHLIMNKTMRRRLTVAARTYTIGGFITYDQDAFGRTQTMYNDLPILIADKDNTNTAILPFSEAAATPGAAASTSIYCVSFTEDGVIGLQNGDMDVRDLGEIESKPVYRTRVEWYTSISVMRENSAARLMGISNAAIVV